jgi:hypothetical protein
MPPWLESLMLQALTIVLRELLAAHLPPAPAAPAPPPRA